MDKIPLVEKLLLKNERLIKNQKDIMNEFEEGDADGESITIYDSSNLDCEIQILGNLTQKGYDSKQLYNYKDKREVNALYSVDNDGWISLDYDNTDGTQTAFFNYYTNNLDLKLNTDYSIVVEVKQVSGTGRLLAMSSSSSQFNGEYSLFFSNLINNYKNIRKFTTKANDETSFDGLRSFIAFDSGEKGSITFRLSVLEDLTVTAETFEYKDFPPTLKFPQLLKTTTGKNEINVQNQNLSPKLINNKLLYQNTFIKSVKKGERYCISLKGESTGDNRVLLINSSSKEEIYSQENIVVYANNTDNSNSINITKDGYLFTRTATSPSVYTFDYIQIEEGEKATEYKSPQSQNYLLSLGNIELNGFEDNRDGLILELEDEKSSYKKIRKLYFNKKNHKQSFTGNEHWAMDYGESLFNFHFGINTNTIPIYSKTIAKAMSNYYKHNSVQSNLFNNLKDGEFAMQNAYNSFLVKEESIDNVEDWKNKLRELNAAGNPLAVIYPMENPELIDITSNTELVKNLENIINNINTYEGTTYIDSATDAAKPIINLNYKKSNKIIHKNLEKEIENLKALILES